MRCGRSVNLFYVLSTVDSLSIDSIKETKQRKLQQQQQPIGSVSARCHINDKSEW